MKKLLFSLALLMAGVCGSEAKNALVVIAHGKLAQACFKPRRDRSGQSKGRRVERNRLCSRGFDGIYGAFDSIGY